MKNPISAAGLGLCSLLLCVPLGAAERGGSAMPEVAGPRDVGEGPFERLIIRNATIIDGTGAPASSRWDIVIEGDRIAGMQVAGIPGVRADMEQRPEAGEREIDARGMYVLPGFIDSHAHIGHTGTMFTDPDDLEKTAAAVRYIYKLWLAHGLTTVRTVGSMIGLEWEVEQARRVAAGEVAAPDILPYEFFFPTNVTNEAEARQWVRDVKKKGGRGVKFHSGNAQHVAAAIEETVAVGIGSTMHHAQVISPQLNVLDTARLGLGSMEHFWYGLPETLFEGQSLQEYPIDHDYNDEQHRFIGAARIWSQAAKPHSEKWNAVMEELLSLGFAISPTFSVKSATRDFMRSYLAEWHDEYTPPWLWEFYRPSRLDHGSFQFDWTSNIEAWAREDYRLGMAFVNEYKNRRGRVTVGSDSGFVYSLYGFGYIRELELLREAGFSPLEVIRAATMHGAEVLGIDQETGTLQVGRKADLIISPENPLYNLKVFYGTKAIRLNDESGQVERYGGLKWTIKDGIVYDVAELLAQVRDYVSDEKRAAGVEGRMRITNEG